MNFLSSDKLLMYHVFVLVIWWLSYYCLVYESEIYTTD